MGFLSDPSEALGLLPPPDTVIHSSQYFCRTFAGACGIQKRTPNGHMRIVCQNVQHAPGTRQMTIYMYSEDCRE